MCVCVLVGGVRGAGPGEHGRGSRRAADSTLGWFLGIDTELRTSGGISTLQSRGLQRLTGGDRFDLVPLVGHRAAG